MLKAKFAGRRPAGDAQRPPTSCRCWSADPVKAKRISDILLAEYGLYVQPINYPDRAARHRAAALHPRPDATAPK